jgi:hypothetical protein
LFDYLLSLFPADSPVLAFGRVYASLSLLGSKSATDKCVEVFVSSRFTSTPVKLVIDPMGSTNWAISV